MVHKFLCAFLLWSNLPGVATFSPPLQRVYQQRATFSSKKVQLNLASISPSIPQITEQHLQELQRNNYVVIKKFLTDDLQEALRQDVSTLRKEGHFNIAKIGQDSTNTLNRQIREAQTCFIGGTRPIPDHAARDQMISLLQSVCSSLSQNSLLGSPKLDQNLSELLYAYYPKGGFYRRHRDSIAGSASVLRTFSLLLYLNKDWTEEDAGQLRVHLDSGGDELPAGEEPNFVDVSPEGGTLVLFDSSKIPHEVLDTNSERLAIVGWYNRELAASDIAELGVDPVRLGMMAVAAAMVTVGLVSILS